MDFYDMVSEKAKTFGKGLVDDIESGKIKKDTLPNSSGDFPSAKALESYRTFVNSDEFREIIRTRYEESNA